MALNQNQINGTPLSTSPERPLHYSYLKGFRVEQCALFLQHKCTYHKPYTCFDWHFQNQRRRRPVRRRDGTFNYSPDTYCTKYDEPTGMCPDKDDCPYLHKTAGDTERRYHLRYYKTSMCVYETDPRGYCSKNGKHCAFAHGPQDLRNPIFDVREMQSLENGNSSGELSDPSGLLSTSAGSTSLDRERNALLEDPRWNEIAYVLANYKTELCTRPPRFCRQGYACPQYHNGKDRRRSPRIFRYRSTPCPNTKQGDEWVDPSKCEQGDQCPFCHSRTEQQFHPEIFKSTKCKDMQDSGYCPRNAFCAFAHNDKEIVATRDIDLDNIDGDNNSSTKSEERETLNTWLGVSFAEQNNTELPSSLLSSIGTASPNQSTTTNTLGPIARPRSYSHSQAKSVNMESFNQLHAALARARLIDELKMQSYNVNTSSNNPIGFRERAVHSFSIPSATEATQLLFNKNSPITALDFLPSSRLSNLNLSRKDIDLGPLVTSSSPMSVSINQSCSLSPTVDGLTSKLDLSTNHLESDLPVLPRELKEELQEDLQAELQNELQNELRNELRQEMHVSNQHQAHGASLSTSPERPLHYSYLKGFRVEQCALFLQHKCTYHKPYTCFDWHFQNQRRRRPVRRRDGTFNYSPDTYCTKYDETTGMCPDGDDCPFLHKTAGDTERRYHLRYYKTGMCVYETDSRGFCSKNGKHCAFAHGPQDMRNPVFDVRELQTLETNGANSSGEASDPSGLLSTSAGSQTLERERNALLEDPRWNETAYVLANYKTELCTRPPRFCRQGYACPQYHNGKDRRRSPRIFRYRSTPCPNTKQGDEWVDPSKCEQGDQCPFCHSRTEQQFHPEIFKSTKCKDMQDSGYCPRNAFCAFAHNDKEIVATRDIDLENIDTETSRPMKEMLDTWTNLIL